MKERDFIKKVGEILKINDTGLVTERTTVLDLMRLHSRYTLKLVQTKPHEICWTGKSPGKRKTHKDANKAY